ncbi:MAG: hypothetical protein ACFE0I_23955 [Elainellaceae cyanobacterium]
MNLKRIGFLTLLSGVCLGSLISPQSSDASMNNKQLPRPECENGPVMFGHRNFEGRVVYINRSYSNLSTIDFNDKAGSVCLPRGWVIELFNHENYNRTGTPTHTLYGAGSLSFFEGSGLNNRVSSVRVYYNGELL